MSNKDLFIIQNIFYKAINNTEFLLHKTLSLFIITLDHI